MHYQASVFPEFFSLTCRLELYPFIDCNMPTLTVFTCTAYLITRSISDQKIIQIKRVSKSNRKSKMWLCIWTSIHFLCTALVHLHFDPWVPFSPPCRKPSKTLKVKLISPRFCKVMMLCDTPDFRGRIPRSLVDNISFIQRKKHQNRARCFPKTK